MMVHQIMMKMIMVNEGSVCHTEGMKLYLKNEATGRCQVEMGPAKSPGIAGLGGQRARGPRNKCHGSSLCYWENNNIT